MRAGVALVRLTLTEFRNYAALTWRPEGRVAVFYGPNGSGKTNLLEAVSLLVPGRGLRGARLADLARRGGVWLGGGRAVCHPAGRPGHRHRHAAGGAGGPAGVPARRRSAAQPGRDRRACLGGVADAADGPAVPGGRVRAAAVPGPSGLCAGARTCARGGGARHRHGAAQPAAGRGRRGCGLARRAGGCDGAPCGGRHGGAGGAGGAAERGAAGRRGGGLPGGTIVAVLPDRRAPGRRAGTGGGGLAARGAGGRAGGGCPRRVGARWGRIGPTWGWRMRRAGLPRRWRAPGSRRRC